jgi:hypothetical protein
MTDIAVSVKDILVAAGVGVFAAPTGWSIAISREPTSPDSVITIFPTGGFSPNPKWKVDFPSVQIRIRGNRSGYQAAEAKAKEVKNTLLGIFSLDINGDRLVSITMAGDMTLLTYDDNERPIFVINFRLIVEPSESSHRVAL